MTVRLSFHDGYWYVDVRRNGGTNFRSYARCPTIDEALAKAKEAATGGIHAQP